MILARRLRGWMADRARTWAFRRQGEETSPLVLESRRIYILPTAQGLVFALLLLGMLLGAMNYNNNLGFAVTFLLAACGLVSMYHCHRNLAGLRVRIGATEPVFAGEVARPALMLMNDSARPRAGIVLALDNENQDWTDLGPRALGQVSFSLPTHRRGRVRVRRFALSTTFPLGLFRAWAWVNLDIDCLVFPKPATNAPPPPGAYTDTGGAQQHGEGEDDFAGLRDYRPGDSPRHIAWKAFARGQELLVRQFSGTSVVNHVFDLDSVPSLPLEERLSVLCRWVIDAHAAGEAYGLRLRDEELSPDLGVAHLSRCLGALATFGLDGDD